VVDGVATDPEKVQAVKEWTVPHDLCELWVFLGLIGYYRQYIPGCAGMAQHLNWLAAKGVRPVAVDTEEAAGIQLSKATAKGAPILAYPDPSREHIPDTDASSRSMVTVLFQVQGKSEVVIAYYSKTVLVAKITTALLERSVWEGGQVTN